MADPRLFDPGPAQRPDRNYDPNEWVKSPDVVWHSSESATPPKPTPQPVPSEYYPMQSAEHYKAGAMHFGTVGAAYERQRQANMGTHPLPPRENVYPYALSGQFAKPSGSFESSGQKGQTDVWADDAANDPGRRNPNAVAQLRRGKNIRYLNAVEHKGSISVVTARPENLSTWSESTLSDPKAPSHLRALAEHYELTSQRSGQRSSRQEADVPLPGMPPAPGGSRRILSAPPEGTVGLTTHSGTGTIAHVLKRKY